MEPFQGLALWVVTRGGWGGGGGIHRVGPPRPEQFLNAPPSFDFNGIRKADAQFADKRATSSHHYSAAPSVAGPGRRVSCLPTLSLEAGDEWDCRSQGQLAARCHLALRFRPPGASTARLCRQRSRANVLQRRPPRSRAQPFVLPPRAR